ncbi:MAG: hypothetical protein EPN26_00060 [Rhodospirillales bacterium]|nr:MAG: hypothetical protein EPN26_00060 [Rhodospirillales bacterium]
MAKGKSLFSQISRALFKGEDAAQRKDGISLAKKREEETWVALALNDLLKKHPKSRLQVISLKEYRTAIGEAWESRANTILMLSESTLRRHLNQVESCFKQGEDAFLLLMPGADDKESAKRAYDAAVQLGQKLVGEKFTTGKQGGVVPQVRIANVALADLVNADGRVDVGAVLALAEQAVAVTKAAPKTEPKLVAGDKPVPKDGWNMVAHQPQRRPAELLPIQQASSERKKKPEPNWAPLEKDK